MRFTLQSGPVLMFVCATGLLWADEETTPGEMTQLAGKLPGSGEVHLAMYNQEEPDGFMRLGWYREGEDLVLYDRTMMPSMEIYESMEARVSQDDFAPRSVSIQFHRGSAIMRIDAVLEENHVVGERAVERPGVATDTTPIELATPESTMLRAVTFLLPLLMGQEPNTALAYHWYAPLGNAVQSVSLTATDGGTVETPAGAFDTVRYELRGGTPENDIYVSRGAEPRIVRIDVLGQPLQFLAPATTN